MFTDTNGATYSVTLEPYGDALAVVIRHPAYNGGEVIAITGCRAEIGAIDSVKAWAEQLHTGGPEALTGIDGVTHARS